MKFEYVYILTNPAMPDWVKVGKSNNVIYDGQKYTISGLAVKLCGYNVNGYTRFMFEDETLWKRRQRLHPEL